MSSVAIITARGGSKRIPRKNIRPFCGKEIIAWSIEAALVSGVFDEVMVSTDDEEIARISQKYGAAVPFMRSAATSDDHSTTVDVVLEVVDCYAQAGRSFENLCVLYPTAPFLTAERLKGSYEKFIASGADALIPLVSFSFPVQRAFIIGEDERLFYKWPENQFKRSQDLEKFYHDAGQFYFIRTQALKEQRSMVPANTTCIVLDEIEVQDIDNETDWKLAEMKWTLLHS